MCRYAFAACKRCHSIEQCHIDYCDPVKEYLTIIDPPQPMLIRSTAINVTPLENCTGVAVSTALLHCPCRFQVEWNPARSTIHTPGFDENEDNGPISPTVGDGSADSSTHSRNFDREMQMALSGLGHEETSDHTASNEEEEEEEVEPPPLESVELDEPIAESVGMEFDPDSAVEEQLQEDTRRVDYFGGLPATFSSRPDIPLPRIPLPAFSIPRREPRRERERHERERERYERERSRRHRLSRRFAPAYNPA